MPFKMPAKADLKSRTSTISNAFAISITPYIKPTKEQEKKLMEILDISEGQCAYCLRYANSTDHFRPLVDKGEPSGFISDIHNLVPCCASCNSSKGKRNWDEWFLSEKNIKNLESLGLSKEDINHRFECLKNFSNNANKKLNYWEILGEEKWNEFLSRKNKLNEMLKENQKFCDELNAQIKASLREE